MSNTLEELIFNLRKLQKNETETLKIRHLLNSIPRKISALDNRVAEYEQKIADRELEQRELKKQYREQEADVQQNAERIKRSQVKLDSIKSNREYQALLKEIDNLKATNSRIEDEMLTSLDRIETNEREIKAAKNEYAHVTDETSREKGMIQSQDEENRAKMAQLEADREKIAQRIDPRVLKQFQQIKTMIPDSNVIVPVREAVCEGCHMSIMPQTYNDLQRSEKLMSCPHCQRMIYYEHG